MATAVCGKILSALLRSEPPIILPLLRIVREATLVESRDLKTLKASKDYPLVRHRLHLV
jgi:hypothetical protein